MSYDYSKQRQELFTESGMAALLAVRDRAKSLLEVAGAFRGDKISGGGDSWTTLAALDYMVETGELVKLRDEYACWGQFQVYSSPKTFG